MIKSEIRILENVQIPLTNGSFLGGGTEGWTGTGSTTWLASEFNNTIRKIAQTNDTPHLLTQSIDIGIDYDTISLTYFPGATPFRVNYTVMNDNNSGHTFTPYFGGVAGTTRNENGTFYDIFYIGEGYSNLIKIAGTDYLKINSTSDDFLIWG